MVPSQPAVVLYVTLISAAVSLALSATLIVTESPLIGVAISAFGAGVMSALSVVLVAQKLRKG
jgi:hypothetical protein